MINTFIIIKDNIKQAYNDIETFETKIRNFKDVEAGFGYDLKIKLDDNGKWNVIARLWTDERIKKEIYKADVDLLKQSKQL